MSPPCPAGPAPPCEFSEAPAADASQVAWWFLLNKSFSEGQAPFPGGEKIPEKQKGVLSRTWLRDGAGNRYFSKGQAGPEGEDGCPG